MGGQLSPRCGMLVDGSHQAAEGPSVETAGAHPVESKVVFFSFDGAFGTGAVVGMGLPEGGVPRDRGAEAGVGLGIGIDGASIGGGRAGLREGTDLARGVGKRWASPFDARTIRTASPRTEGEVSRTEGMALFVEGKGRRIGAVSLVAFIEGDEEAQVPVGLEEVVSHGIVGFV